MNNLLRKDTMIVYFIVGICVANILYVFPNHNNLSMFNSLLGLTGVFLYIKGNRHFTNVLWVWAGLQALVIQTQHLDRQTLEIVTHPKFDLRQYSPLSFTLGTKLGNVVGGEIDIQFNTFVFLLWGLPYVLKASSFLGKTIKLTNTGKNLDLKTEGQITLTINNLIKTGKKDQSLLGILNTPIHLGTTRITHLLVMLQDGFIVNNFHAIDEKFRIVHGETIDTDKYTYVYGLAVDDSGKSIFA